MENIKKLLINGGAGYIGSNTINTLFYLYPQMKFIVIDLKKKPSYINKDIVKSDRFKYYSENMGNRKKIMKILKKNSIEYVLDLASFLPFTKVPEDEFIVNNTACRYNFFDICAEYGKIKHYVYQASLFVTTNLLDNYNGTKNIFLPTEHQYDHILYTTTKTEGYSFAYNFQNMKKLPLTIVSPANVYGGKNQHKQDEILFFTNELCKTGKIILVENSNNNSVNWIFIMDVINGYQIIFNQGPTGNNYNLINTNQYYTDEQVVQFVIKYVKNTTNYSDYIVYDLNKLTISPNEINYDIQTNFTTEQFITTDNFEQEIQKVAKCKC